MLPDYLSSYSKYKKERERQKEEWINQKMEEWRKNAKERKPEFLDSAVLVALEYETLATRWEQFDRD